MYVLFFILFRMPALITRDNMSSSVETISYEDFFIVHIMVWVWLCTVHIHVIV